DRALTHPGVLLCLLAEGGCVRERLQHPPARGPGRVERTALHQAFDRALVHGASVDALTEVPDRAELASLGTRVEDRLHRDVTDVLHRVQAEADAVARDDEAMRGEGDDRRPRRAP